MSKPCCENLVPGRKGVTVSPSYIAACTYPMDNIRRGEGTNDLAYSGDQLLAKSVTGFHACMGRKPCPVIVYTVSDLYWFQFLVEV